jgi:uncharacterized protein YqgC (DUF456 family)
LSPFEIAGLTVFILVLFLGIFLTVFGLPGTVLILLDVIGYALLTGFAQIGFKVILMLLLITIVAELLDIGLGMAGAVRFGSSRAGMWAALIGSFAGVVLLTPYFLGLGVLMGVFLGGGAAVFMAEMIQRGKLKPAFRASIGAMLGRMMGIAVKGALSIVMVAFTLFHIYS